ncbi:MAG: DUF1573 domain-containing protein [Bacteroidota bacterium]
MKKLSALFLTAMMAMAFVACQSTGTATEGESAAVANNPAAPATTTPATPAAPRQPDYIATAESAARTSVEWTDEEYNYGKVSEGTKVTYQFRFKNTGTEPLTLTRVKPSCGCTTPTYSKDPVAPGEDGFIDVSFNTSGKSGVQNKTVTVTGNFDGSVNKILRINGEVERGQAQPQ